MVSGRFAHQACQPLVRRLALLVAEVANENHADCEKKDKQQGEADGLQLAAPPRSTAASTSDRRSDSGASPSR
jgi:hypothetical protein